MCMQKTLVWFLVLAAFIGLADSGYLSAMSLTGTPLNCAILEGCNTVVASPYSKVFGIPLAVFGVAFYAVALIFAAALLSSTSLKLRHMMLAWSVLGVLFSAYFAYLQYFVIGAICIYCVVSAIATVLLLLFSGLLLRRPQ